MNIEYRYAGPEAKIGNKYLLQSWLIALVQKKQLQEVDLHLLPTNITIKKRTKENDLINLRSCKVYSLSKRKVYIDHAMLLCYVRGECMQLGRGACCKQCCES